jgi:hypothetical protein
MTTSCIFQTDWWLDAAAPRAWQAAQIKKDNQVIARLPYAIKRKKGLTLLTLPPFTHGMGPWLAPSTAKYAKQLGQQKELLTELIHQLPEHDYFSQKCHYSFTNWLPFHWNGFSQTTAYTYILPDLSDLDKVWSGFQDNIRREIRKAEKQVTVSVTEDIDTIYKIGLHTFQRQGLPYPYTYETVRDFDCAIAKHDARRMFVAKDEQGRIHAAVYIVWDERSAYYLTGGSDAELRTSGAMSLLLWEAIQFAATVSQEFDFVGSMNESIERFFRGFGARQTPYFVLSRMSRRMRLLMSGREIVSTLRTK